MAVKSVSVRTDDIDGATDAQERIFWHDGKAMTIDLAGENLAEFDRAAADLGERFARHAHPLNVPARAKGARRTSGSRAARTERTNAIRSWAHENGHAISERGRIAKNVLEAYDAANGTNYAAEQG